MLKKMVLMMAIGLTLAVSGCTIPQLPTAENTINVKVYYLYNNLADIDPDREALITRTLDSMSFQRITYDSTVYELADMEDININSVQFSGQNLQQLFVYHDNAVQNRRQIFCEVDEKAIDFDRDYHANERLMLVYANADGGFVEFRNLHISEGIMRSDVSTNIMLHEEAHVYGCIHGERLDFESPCLIFNPTIFQVNEQTLCGCTLEPEPNKVSPILLKARQCS